MLMRRTHVKRARVPTASVLRLLNGPSCWLRSPRRRCDNQSMPTTAGVNYLPTRPAAALDQAVAVEDGVDW